MKVLRRIPTLTVFGAGFLLGSKSGPGAWNKAMEKFNEFQGKTGMDIHDMDVGQMKEKATELKDQAQSRVAGMKSSGRDGGGDGSPYAGGDVSMTSQRGGDIDRGLSEF